MIDGVKGSRRLADVLPQPFVSGCRGRQSEKLLGLRLSALRINDESLKLCGIPDEWAGIHDGEIDANRTVPLKCLRS